MLLAMSKWMLEWFWCGKTFDEIAEAAPDPNVTGEHVRITIEDERQKLVTASLKAVTENARKGDITSIEWLEKRGLIDFANRRSDG